MTIKEVEETTGLNRSNIRFYEKENLIAPMRNSGNGYREYSERDVAAIRNIAFLRTLDISIEDIRRILRHEVSLHQVLTEQYRKLDSDISALESARNICGQMLKDRNLQFDSLVIENYTDNVPRYWKRNRQFLKFDTVSFLSLWGSLTVWVGLTLLCLLVAVVSYFYLPEQIPIQWSGEKASSYAAKGFIFLYPAACMIIRFLLKPFLQRWLDAHGFHGEFLADYLTNYLCFLALSVEVFTILFAAGVLKHVTIVLFADTVVLIGVMLVGWNKSGGLGPRNP